MTTKNAPQKEAKLATMILAINRIIFLIRGILNVNQHRNIGSLFKKQRPVLQVIIYTLLF